MLDINARVVNQHGSVRNLSCSSALTLYIVVG